MTDTDPESFLRINDFARETAWLHPLMTGWASYAVAVTGWVLARRVLTKAVIRLTATRWRGLVTADRRLDLLS